MKKAMSNAQMEMSKDEIIEWCNSRYPREEDEASTGSQVVRYEHKQTGALDKLLAELEKEKEKKRPRCESAERDAACSPEPQICVKDEFKSLERVKVRPSCPKVILCPISERYEVSYERTQICTPEIC